MDSVRQRDRATASMSITTRTTAATRATANRGPRS